MSDSIGTIKYMGKTFQVTEDGIKRFAEYIAALEYNHLANNIRSMISLDDADLCHLENTFREAACKLFLGKQPTQESKDELSRVTNNENKDQEP